LTRRARFCSLRRVNPRVHQCPQCGAPLETPDGALSTRCKFCHVEVKLADPIAHHYGNRVDLRVASTPPAPVYAHVPATPLLPASVKRVLGKALFVLCALAAGLLVMPTISLLARDGGGIDMAVVVAVLGSLIGFALFFSRRVILGAALPLLLGFALVAKPFVKPVMYEGRAFSLTSETHLFFLVPGFLVLGVFGTLLLIGLVVTKERKGKEDEDSAALRVGAAVALGLGVGLSLLGFGGPTKGDVIAQYRLNGQETREAWNKMAAALPKPGSAVPRDRKLAPPPVWSEERREASNIEIVAASELANPDVDPPYMNLLLSGDLLHAVRWTGPKNPMAGSARDERAGDFAGMLAKAFETRWLAAYRPRAGTLTKTGGSDALEVFVFDAKTGELMAATTTETVDNWSEARRALLSALGKTVGGTFEER
jgi:hypothetical protein